MMDHRKFVVTGTSLPKADTHKLLLVLSGGQDSTTCLYLALAEGVRSIYCVTFDYGQRHRCEVEAARAVVLRARQDYPHAVITHEVITVPDVLEGTSPLTAPDIELEQYADAASLPGGIEKTFVPCRNMFFATLAANRAAVLGCNVMALGVSQEDYGGYPDCRIKFIEHLALALNYGTFTGEEGAFSHLYLWTPLMFVNKAESIRLLMKTVGGYEALAYTHTAYDGNFPPTGKDHASLLRAQAFDQAGVPDPLVLRAVKLGLMPLPDSIAYAAVRYWKDVSK